MPAQRNQGFHLHDADGNLLDGIVPVTEAIPSGDSGWVRLAMSVARVESMARQAARRVR